MAVNHKRNENTAKMRDSINDRPYWPMRLSFLVQCFSGGDRVPKCVNIVQCYPWQTRQSGERERNKILFKCSDLLLDAWEIFCLENAAFSGTPYSIEGMASILKWDRRSYTQWFYSDLGFGEKTETDRERNIAIHF